MEGQVGNSSPGLCDRCRGIFRGHWAERAADDILALEDASTIETDEFTAYERPDWVHASSIPSGGLSPLIPYVHHSLSALAASASSRCPLCSMIWDKIQDMKDELGESQYGDENKAIGIVVVRPGLEDEDGGNVSLELQVSYFRNGEYDNPDAYVPLCSSVDLEPSQSVLHRTMHTPKSEADAAESSASTVLEWLTDCQRNHKQCLDRTNHDSCQPAQVWPARLLDLTLGETDPSIRLIESKNLQEFSPYVTLSHCWGGTVPIRLLTTNYPSYLNEISLHDLPLTFQHAITFTRALGVQYLWIDALCIIQDSATDWLSESLRMADIYTHGLVNLAATASPNSHGGLFPGPTTHNPSPSSPCIISATWTGHPAGTYIALDPSSWDRTVEAAPLNRRAWVFQERVLASRTVHFARDHRVWWTCAEAKTCQGFPKGWPVSTGDREDAWAPVGFREVVGTDPEKNEVWVRYLREYTKLDITRDADRLVALAGVARGFGEGAGWREEEYFAGFWRRDLEVDLLWRMVGGGTRVQREFVAPSWSWASVRGEVYFHGSGNRQEIREGKEVEVRDIDVETRGGRFGLVIQGSIELTGFLYAVQFSDVHLEPETGFARLSIRHFHELKSGEDFEEVLDDEQVYRQAAPYGMTAYWVNFMTSRTANEEGEFKSEGLLLQPIIDLGDACYRRIGWMRVFSTDREWLRADLDTEQEFNGEMPQDGLRTIKLF